MNGGSRFFLEPDAFLGDGRVVIEGDDAVHIGRSLRMSPGEPLILCSLGVYSDGKEYHAEIVSIGKKCVECYVKAVVEPIGEITNIRTVLFQALPKGDKLEFIIQKAVELGVSEIVPVQTERCVSRFSKLEDFDSKLARLRRISKEAAQQSHRAKVPDIKRLIDFDSAVSQLKQMDCSLFCYEGGGSHISDILSCNLKTGDIPTVGIFVGSEGGFSEKEAAEAMRAGLFNVTLGNRILRCETAPIVAITLVGAFFGEF